MYLYVLRRAERAGQGNSVAEHAQQRGGQGSRVLPAQQHGRDEKYPEGRLTSVHI